LRAVNERRCIEVMVKGEVEGKVEVEGEVKAKGKGNA
jgi:hypothetical protein